MCTRFFPSCVQLDRVENEEHGLLIADNSIFGSSIVLISVSSFDIFLFFYDPRCSPW
jgi:hypothetical protein